MRRAFGHLTGGCAEPHGTLEVNVFTDMNEQPKRRRFQLRLSTLMLCVAIVGLSLGWWIDHYSRVTKRMLPHDPHLDAIYERFGNPDRVSGSGFISLHYDLENGQTVILTVSNGITDAYVTRRK